MSRNPGKTLLALCGFLLLRVTVLFASGHGPLFALATPTNANGQWSLDFATLVIRDQQNTGTVFRPILSYGVSESFMLSLSTPFIAGESESLTPALGSFEALATYRWLQQNKGVGSRLESIIFGGVIFPVQQFGALRLAEKTPGFQFGGCGGLVSRSHYIWVGGSYTAFQESNGDRRPDLIFYSAAWGYRPIAWRKEYPSWDWRFFVEATGEMFGDLQINNLILRDTDEHQLLVGPAILGQYRSLAIEAGIQFAVYRNTGLESGEKLRFGFTSVYYF